MESLQAVAEGLLATRYLSAAGLSVLIWDHCLTLEREKQLIWRSHSSFVKWLFLATRYSVPIVLSIEAYTMSGINPSTLSETFCQIWFAISFVLGATTLLVVNFLVMLKLWKLWDGKRVVLIFSILAFAVTGTGTVIIIALLTHETISSINFSMDLRVCAGTNTPRLLKVLWALNCSFDLFVLLMVLWNALSRPREERTLLANVLYRDGILFFLSISAMGWMNFFVATVAPPSLSLLGVFSNEAVTVTIVFRMLMNVREAERLMNESHEDESMSLSVWADSETEGTVSQRGSHGF